MKQITIKTAKNGDLITMGIDDEGVFIQCEGDVENSNDSEFVSFKFYFNSFEVDKICRILESLGWDEETNEEIKNHPMIIREMPKNICGFCESCSCVCNEKNISKGINSEL